MWSAKVHVASDRLWVSFDDGDWCAAPLTQRVTDALERLWPGHGAVFGVSGLDAAAAFAMCAGDWAGVERAIDGDWQVCSDRTLDLWEELILRWAGQDPAADAVASASGGDLPDSGCAGLDGPAAADPPTGAARWPDVAGCWADNVADKAAR